MKTPTTQPKSSGRAGGWLTAARPLAIISLVLQEQFCIEIFFNICYNVLDIDLCL